MKSRWSWLDSWSTRLGGAVILISGVIWMHNIKVTQEAQADVLSIHTEQLGINSKAVTIIETNIPMINKKMDRIETKVDGIQEYLIKGAEDERSY